MYHYFVVLTTGFFVWGLIYSVQAPFYADEALRRGASLSQVQIIISKFGYLYMCVVFLSFQSGLVFGVVHLSAFIASSLMSIFGYRFSVRTMSFLGAIFQGVTVIAFGMLEFTDDVAMFLTLSYGLRLVGKFYF